MKKRNAKDGKKIVEWMDCGVAAVAAGKFGGPICAMYSVRLKVSAGLSKVGFGSQL